MELAQLLDFKPDGDRSTPLYLQLANKLALAICQGFWQPEEALPSERVLADTLVISRVTARKAIDVLCERGLLARRHGSGTYITAKLEQPLLRTPPFIYFNEELRERGFAPCSQWLSRETGLASPEESLSLGLLHNAPVCRLIRLRTADSVPVAIEAATISQQYLNNPELIENCLYTYLESNNLAPVRAIQQVRAINATPEQARLLGIQEGTAVLSITRVAYLKNDVAIDRSHFYYRSDYYDFVVELFK